MLEKNIIREQIKKKRKKNYFLVSPEFFKPIFKIIKKKIQHNLVYLSIYYPSNFEVDVLQVFKVLKNKKIKTLLPVIETKKKIEFFEWNFLDTLNVNSFGMLEPVLKKKPIVPNIMLIPLIAYDSMNYRLGYGKGFYDRFLNKFLKKKKNIITIGIAFSFQKYNKLPVSKFDVKLDYILTEKGIIK